MLPAQYRWLEAEPGPRMIAEALKQYGTLEAPGPPCDSLAGLHCDVIVRKCQKIDVVGAGKRCGPLIPGQADCDVDSVCDVNAWVCVAKKKLGEPCTGSIFCASGACTGNVCIDPYAVACSPSRK